MKVHAGEILYNSDVYRKSFAHKFIQSELMKVHTGEKNLINVICVENSFEQKLILTEHMRVHTGERSYNCDVCGYILAQKMYIGRTCKGSHWENFMYL